MITIEELIHRSKKNPILSEQLHKEIEACMKKRGVQNCKECLRYADGNGRYVNAFCDYHVGTLVK